LQRPDAYVTYQSVGAENKKNTPGYLQGKTTMKRSPTSKSWINWKADLNKMEASEIAPKNYKG